MNDKQAIINKIISDAQEKAKANADAAREKADAVIAEAERAANEYIGDKLADKETRVNEIIQRKRSVARLDMKREIATCKSNLTAQVFDKACDALKADKKAYLQYIAAIIKSAAEDGDKVIISEEDKDVISESFIKKAASAAKVKVSLAKETGAFKGGVILAGKGYDKNLTLEEDMRAVREQCETQVAKILFEE